MAAAIHTACIESSVSYAPQETEHFDEECA
jgi:hypothetical protein